MPVVAENAPAPTLAAVIGQVRDALGAMANNTTVMVGKRYVEDFGTGREPRVLFVPESGGTVGPGIETGNSVSITHSCDVMVRGAETGDDITRFDAVYALADLVVDLIQTAATGRIEWGGYTDSSPSDSDGFGAEVTVSFKYRRDVPHNAARWALPSASSSAAKRPQVPPGTPATVLSIDPTTAPPS